MMMFIKSASFIKMGNQMTPSQQEVAKQSLQAMKDAGINISHLCSLGDMEYAVAREHGELAVADYESEYGTIQDDSVREFVIEGLDSYFMPIEYGHYEGYFDNIKELINESEFVLED